MSITTPFVILLAWIVHRKVENIHIVDFHNFITETIILLVVSYCDCTNMEVIEEFELAFPVWQMVLKE